MYDVDSSGTASQHRAPYGDSYNINLFERPFTQKDMTYMPMWISQLSKSPGDNWYYVFITFLIGSNPNDPVNIDYGVEIDKVRDGFGDVLVWAQPPYQTEWTTDGLKFIPNLITMSAAHRPKNQTRTPLPAHLIRDMGMKP